MKTPTRLAAAAIGCTLALLLAAISSINLATVAASATTMMAAQQISALHRGYRTGYSDGYQAGYRDAIEQAARDARRHEDYRGSERAYVQAYGSLEEYRDGYRQGFEGGYDAGYDRRGFDSSVPANLARSDNNDDQNNNGGVSDSSARGGVVDNDGLRGMVSIPQDTTMRVELLTSLSTDATQRGDRFDARVIEPAEYAGAVASGRVSRVKRSGKVRGSSELQLSFEQLRLPDGRFASFKAQVIEVVRKGDGVGEVDGEGGVRGGSTTKDDVTKVGAGVGIGAIIGAIAGGGKGAAIGAAIGAGVGTGGVLASRGGDIRLERGEELIIRTSTDTEVR